ncbi:auxin efflux carrier transmembrane protein [Hysterangium stoloniferum]|nr:auxin efflux carrier transmembrane protein [Hysterangium stoloniferum]
MSTQLLGTLIWISVKPMLRLLLCVGTGFIITKNGRLPPIAARGVAQIILNIALPSLFFSRVVPAFNYQNIKAMGPLVLACVIYQGIGLFTSLVVSAFFWVPHRFRWGIIVAGVWGNYGDLPTAIIMSVTAAAPFKAEDQTLAVGYIAGFVLIFMITLFPMGGHHLVGKDFQGPDRADTEVKISFVKKSKVMAAYLAQISRLSCFAKTDLEAQQSMGPVSEEEQFTNGVLGQEESTYVKSDLGQAQPGEMSESGKANIPYHDSTTKAALTSTLPRRIFSKIAEMLRVVLSVPTAVVVIAFLISVIPELKALFVLLPSSSTTPDGQPPLAFILDTATFLGGASVPLGLIGLGSALARINIPRSEWRKLPFGSIMGLALGRMVLQPVLGVLIVRGFTNVGLISEDDKVLQFVAIIFSCVPTATIQISITQIHSAVGAVEHLPAYLVPQYGLMLVSCTILTAYALHNLFG